MGVLIFKTVADSEEETFLDFTVVEKLDCRSLCECRTLASPLGVVLNWTRLKEKQGITLYCFIFMSNCNRGMENKRLQSKQIKHAKTTTKKFLEATLTNQIFFFSFTFVFFRRGFMGMFWLCLEPKHWLVFVCVCVFYSLYLNRPSSFHCRTTAAYARYALLGKGRHHIALGEIVHTYEAIELLKPVNSN